MPKDNKQQQGRTQSRRAASKEALKQMHILLGEEKQLEISSDDDVIEVELQPPKKKYKLSNRKSSDDRDVIVLKTVNNAEESIFDLEVVVEDLTPAQKSRRELLLKEEKEVDAKVEQLLRTPHSEVIYNGVCTTALEITEQLQSVLTGTPTQFTVPQQSSLGTSQTSVAGQSILLQQQPASSSNAIPQSYQLVMDPRLGVIVGAVSTPSAASPTPPLQLYQQKVTIPTTASATPETGVKTRRGPVVRQPPIHKTTTTSALVQQKQATPAKKTLQVKQVLQKPVTPKTQTQKVTPKAIMPLKNRAQTTPSTAPFRPSENSVEGGLNTGSKPAKSIDLTSEDGRALPDSREVSFNKLQGRTYPSLVVVARPHLRVKDLAADRGKLDVKVKSVLMYPPTKFTEWLIQQGLVKSDQKCSVHANNALKLGMYSDASKFPYSGGYVWISECCPQRFVSVFSGSLFEGSQHPPMAILKLLYHWSCQTIVQNVTQWVKVDNLYVKGMYTWLRSICTVALHSHIKQLGGPGVKVQVGVISLGTTSQDGNKREVKVEVLGILETSTRHIRLRAVEPLTDAERNYKKRFTKILEPVFNWVHPSSVIVTDLTVDKATLHQMGFMHVSQSTSTDYAQSNRTIMEYLRRIVPRMFQNTLSLLSRQIIQQFLDELVWREWYGTTVLQCFDNMVQHLSEQTRYDSGQSLITRLNKVSGNPFKNWSIPIGGNNNTNTPKTIEQPAPKRYSRQRKPVTPQPPVTPNQEVVRPAKSTSPDVPEQMVPLENYYYGTISALFNSKAKVTINIKCPFCKLVFNTNITLMNHLFKHAHNVSNDVQLCKYCLTIVPSGNDLLKHINTSHPDETKFDNGFVCLICEAHFRNPFILGKHMSKEHCPSELPYMCGTCNFRCSNHKQAVDHFYQQHDHGTTIQCPFCLKSTTVYSGGRNISQNMNYFIQHLQKHQRKQLAKRCGRCTLWFIQKEFLKEHQTKMHISQRGKHGLVPCFAPRNGVMVPKSRMDKCPDDAKVINFSTLHFNVGKNLNCKECSKPLNTPKHFASFESCQNSNCQFSTCCSNSMQEHVSVCKSMNSKLPAEKLPYQMFCICGYSDIYGNQMAKHLAICERRSAYPSMESAKQATVTHSMLDVLGLVRKPDEATSSKQPPKRESSQPLILKRGRPRKHVDTSSPVVINEVIDLNDEDLKEIEVSEVSLNISEVRGGVDNELNVKENENDEMIKTTKIEDEKAEEAKRAEIIELNEEKKDETEKEENKKNETVEEEKKDETVEEEKIDEIVEEEKKDETVEDEKEYETIEEEKEDETLEEEKEDETVEEEKEDETIEEEKEEETVEEEETAEEEKKNKTVEEGETDETVEEEKNDETYGEEKNDEMVEEEKKKDDAVEEKNVETVEEEEEKKNETIDEEDIREESALIEPETKQGEKSQIASEQTESEVSTQEHDFESEPMDLDNCHIAEEEVDKEGATIAIEINMENEGVSKGDDNINSVCPMDTD